jgi:hypothetical protein
MRSLTSAFEIGTLLNWSNPQGASRLGTSLYIPYFDVYGNNTTYCRIKPEIPPKGKDDKPRKYLGPSKTALGVYFPKIGAERYLDPERTLLFTEGEKKAICAALHGYPTIGFGGVSGWSIKRKKDADGKPIGPRQLRPEIANLPLKNRRVYIAFDSDRATNQDVLRKERALAAALESSGAVVRIIEIPEGSDGHKQGLDDFLVHQGPEAFKVILAQALPASETQISVPLDRINNPHHLAYRFLVSSMNRNVPLIHN